MDELQFAVGDAYIAIDERAADVKKELAYYAQHIRDGGDPTKLPKNQTWYMNPIREFAPGIVNAWREQNGIEPNPYHPATAHFKLFDFLRSDNWRSAKDAQALLHGSRVQTYLRDHELARAGYRLDSAKIDGRVHYRLTKVSD
jgi:hypothetical protein